MTNQKNEDKTNSTLDKIKKYAPIIATSVAALALGAVTGGVGLLVAGIVVAGVVYVQSADALKEELVKSAGPKINRPLQFEDNIEEDGQSLNGRDFFKVPEDTKLDNKSYLMLGTGKNANLYYIDGEGNARKMKLTNPGNFQKFIEEQRPKLMNKMEPNTYLNKMIQNYVVPDKLQTTRQTTKKVVAGIGLAVAIAGIVAALPFAGIPIVGALAICGVGLGIAFAAPFIGRMLKKIFNRGGETKKETSQSSVPIQQTRDQASESNNLETSRLTTSNVEIANVSNLAEKTIGNTHPIQQSRNEASESNNLETSSLPTSNAESVGVNGSLVKKETRGQTQDSEVLIEENLKKKFQPQLQSGVRDDKEKLVINKHGEERIKSQSHSFDQLSAPSPLTLEIARERGLEATTNPKSIVNEKSEKDEGEGRTAPH
jgi:hypothetical protein